MNMLNTIIPLLANSDKMNNLLNIFSKRRKQRSGWSIVAYILIGTVIGMLTKRTNSTQVVDTTKDLFQKVKGQAQDKFSSSFEPKINLANIEFGDEFSGFDAEAALKTIKNETDNK
ncbi:hypothetical protein [Bacillus sp. AK128]